MKHGFDWIVGIVDKSGSMERVRSDAIGGINAFIREQQKLEGRTGKLTLALFDHEYHLVHDDAPLGSVRPLSDDAYVPGGSTALLDAIGRTVVAVGRKLAALDEADRPENVVVAILTDGYENASQIYTRDQIRGMIELQQSVYDWKFVFLAATQEGFGDAQAIGVPQPSNFRYNQGDTNAGFVRMSNEVSGFRTAGGTIIPPKNKKH